MASSSQESSFGGVTQVQHDRARSEARREVLYDKPLKLVMDTGRKLDLRTIRKRDRDFMELPCPLVCLRQTPMSFQKLLALLREMSPVECSKNLNGVRGELVSGFTTVRRPRGIVWVSINKSSLLELMYGLAADRFAAIGGIFLTVFLLHPAHDVPNAK